MLSVSKNFIKNFHLRKLGYDLMGYRFNDPIELTFHHLLLPGIICEELGLGDGYEKWNGIMLVRETAHDYLHIVEAWDNNIYYDITSELLDQLIKGRVDTKNIYYIHLLLEKFEKEYRGCLGYNNKPLIKEEYQKSRIFYRRWISEKYYIIN